MRISIDPADRFFSYYVRELADWKCERCHTPYERKSQGLHCSHFFGRRAESTRFCLDNVNAHCFFCHQFLGSNPLEFSQWKRKSLGEERFNQLIMMNNLYKKKDRKMELLIWRQALKELCKEKGIDTRIYNV